MKKIPQSDEKILLAWANNGSPYIAKNSLQLWNGFSSYQLILEKNPNLPNIMTEKLLDAMHSARKTFIKYEADEKARRALRHPVRAREETFDPGDSVFYKKEEKNRWLGPDKVISQDGWVVFVTHDGV